MSGKTQSGFGLLFTIIGGVATGGVYTAAAWLIAGAALSYSGARAQQKEAERRARAARNNAAIHGNIRSSYEHHMMVFGKARVGGIVVTLGYASTAGSTMANQDLFIGVAHSVSHAGGCEGITAIWIDDTKYTLAQITGDPNTTEGVVNAGDHNGTVTVRHYRGTDTQTVNAELLSLGIDSSTDYRARIAWTKFKLRKPDNSDAFQKAYKFGIPTCSVELKGVRCYDPRLDSTQGGSGSHRYTDSLTWAWTDNPILCASTYTIMNQLDGGEGIPPARILWATVAAGANKCDETITTPDGSLSRFSCNGVLMTTDDHAVNLQKILDSCMGRRIPVGGQFAFYAGQWATETVATDQTWLAGSFDVQSLAELDSGYNAVRVNFLDAGQDYKTIEAVPYTNAAYETEDGGRQVWRDMTLSMVNNKYQAQYLGQIVGKKSRMEKIFTQTCNLRGYDVQLWETATVSLPEVDLSPYSFRAVHWEPHDAGIQLVFEQDAAAVYSLDGFVVPSETGSGTVTIGAETPAAPTSLSALAVADGIELSFVPPASFSYATLEVSRSSTAGGTYTVLPPAPRGAARYTDPVTDGATWYYQVRARTIVGTFGPYAGPVSATAKTVANGATVGAQVGLNLKDTAGTTVVTNADGLPESSTRKYAAESGAQVVTGKSIDILVDGTYARPLASRINAGKPVIDFSESIHTGKSLANIPDDATSDRRAATATQLTGGTRAAAAIDSGNVVVAAGVDFSRSYTGKDAGNIPETAGRKWAAESGANITESRTSNDTSNVGARAAATVRDESRTGYNVTVAASGQRLGDQRNEPAITGLNRQPAIATSSPLTIDNSSGGTITVTIAAFTVQGGNFTVSYNSGSKTAADSTYAVGSTIYVYCDDPTYAGGAVTYNLTATASTVTADKGRFFVGQVVVPARGASGTEPPCVQEDSWIGSKRVAAAFAGDELFCMTDNRAFAPHVVESIEPAVRQPCRRIVMAGGAAVVVSVSTPLTLEDGRQILVPQLVVGDRLATRYDGEDRWESVVEIQDGLHENVIRVHCGGRSYAAGEQPEKLVYTHNPLKP